MSLGPYLSRRFFIAFSAVVILFVLLVGASVRLMISEAELGEDIAEDMVWLSSQAQYEAVRFAEALASFSVGSASNADLQLRFDLLTSRVVILEQGEPRRQLEALGKATELDNYRASLQTIEQGLPKITPANAPQIADFRAEAISLAQSLRDVANSALLSKR